MTAERRWKIMVSLERTGHVHINRNNFMVEDGLVLAHKRDSIIKEHNLDNPMTFDTFAHIYLEYVD